MKGTMRLGYMLLINKYAFVTHLTVIIECFILCYQGKLQTRRKSPFYILHRSISFIAEIFQRISYWGLEKTEWSDTDIISCSWNTAIKCFPTVLRNSVVFLVSSVSEAVKLSLAVHLPRFSASLNQHKLDLPLYICFKYGTDVLMLPFQSTWRKEGKMIFF